MARNGAAEAVPLQRTRPGTTTPSAFMIFVLWLVGGLVVALRLARCRLRLRLLLLDPDINRRSVARAAVITLVAGALALLVPIAALRAQSKPAQPANLEIRAPKGGVQGGVPGAYREV